MSLEDTSLTDDKEEQLEERVNVSSWFFFQEVMVEDSNGFNTFTANDENFRHNRENLLLPIQMQLSKKPKTFWNLH